MKADECYRKADRKERQKNKNDHVPGEHVAIETNGERNNAGEVTDRLDSQHQDRKRNAHEDRHAGVLMPQKLLEVFASMLSEPVPVVIEKRTKIPTPSHNRD